MMITKGEKLCCLRSWQKVIRVPSISVTSRRTLDVASIPGTRTGSYSFHSEKFCNYYGIFWNLYQIGKVADY